jgi:hypothetical protein
MNFDEVLLLTYIQGIPGNAIVYMFLVEYQEFKEWSDNDWIKAKNTYYSTFTNPAIAWLHDIYKNRCKYDKQKCIELIQQLNK